jgi:putative hemolysin
MCAPPVRGATAGLTPGGGGTQRLVARADVARATELLMTGDVYLPAEMYQILPRSSRAVTREVPYSYEPFNQLTIWP